MGKVRQSARKTIGLCIAYPVILRLLEYLWSYKISIYRLETHKAIKDICIQGNLWIRLPTEEIQKVLSNFKALLRLAILTVKLLTILHLLTLEKHLRHSNLSSALAQKLLISYPRHAPSTLRMETFMVASQALIWFSRPAILAMMTAFSLESLHTWSSIWEILAVMWYLFKILKPFMTKSEFHLA